MLDEKRLDLFENAKISRAVLTLTVPTILSSLVMVLYNLADTFFVGMLSDPVENAAVTLAAPVLLAFNAVNNLFGVGTSYMMSSSLGRKDYETVKRSSVFGFYASLFLSLLFSFFSYFCMDSLLLMLGADSVTAEATEGYLFWTVSIGAPFSIINVVMAYLVRSEGSAMHASIGTISGCILNMILDPFFILPWGLGMKAEGAGLATCISNVFACMYFLTYIFLKRKSTFVCVNIKYLTFRKNIVKGICAVGIPSSIQNLLNVTGMTILNNFTAAFGASAVAAMGIAQKINQVPTNMNFGLSQGIMPILSYSWAAGNGDRFKKSYKFTIRMSLAFMLLMMTLFLLFAPQLTEIFMDNDEIVKMGSSLLRGFCLALPFLTLDFISVGLFQSTGKGHYSLIFAICRKIVLEIPILVILNRIYPLFGLSFAQPAAELVLAILTIIFVRRVFKEIDKKSMMS